MTNDTFYILDVFAEQPLTGNQLGVFPQAASFTSGRMLALTRELNFAESTFILGPGKGPDHWRVRIFTPGGEVPFAGHPTLGTATLIRDIFDGEGGQTPEVITLNLAAGDIPVRFTGQDGASPPLATMTQNPPEFGREIPAADVAPVLNVATSDLDDRFPCQVVSTGLPFLIVPMKDLGTVRRARLDYDAYDRLVENHDAPLVFFFAPEAYDPGFHIAARMFGPGYGVPEDAATGSANGCLGSYLLQHGVLGEGAVDVRVQQGHEIGRPSVLYVQAEHTSDGIRVRVGGRAFIIAQGEWRA
ncbi:MAG: PhzF family phenazine biosynthesis protein [Gemmatimonadetes bacterium]|nr:PhzF family phenazine biosynthesis protein [Gemmatimonadota bacterium]